MTSGREIDGDDIYVQYVVDSIQRGSYRPFTRFRDVPRRQPNSLSKPW